MLFVVNLFSTVYLFYLQKKRRKMKFYCVFESEEDNLFFSYIIVCRTSKYFCQYPLR